MGPHCTVQSHVSGANWHGPHHSSFLKMASKLHQVAKVHCVMGLAQAIGIGTPKLNKSNVVEFFLYVFLCCRLSIPIGSGLVAFTPYNFI